MILFLLFCVISFDLYDLCVIFYQSVFLFYDLLKRAGL